MFKVFFNVFLFLEKIPEDINMGKRSPRANPSFVEPEVYTKIYGNPSFKNTQRFCSANFTKKESVSTLQGFGRDPYK